METLGTSPPKLAMYILDFSRRFDCFVDTIDELQRGPRQYPRGLGPVSGPPLVPTAPVAVASSAVEGQEQGGRGINYIGGANVVILKRPTEEEAGSGYENFAYPITAAPQKSAPPGVPRPRNFKQTLRVTKPAWKNSEKSVAHQAFKNLDQLNESTVRSPSLSPPSPEDEEVEDSATVRGNNYGMRGALNFGQDKQVQFEDQDDGVDDWLTPRHYHHLPQGAKTQDDWAVKKEPIPIKMAEGKDGFQVGAFFDIPVTLLRWQFLESPQWRIQLDHAQLPLPPVAPGRYYLPVTICPQPTVTTCPGQKEK